MDDTLIRVVATVIAIFCAGLNVIICHESLQHLRENIKDHEEFLAWVRRQKLKPKESVIFDELEADICWHIKKIADYEDPTEYDFGCKSALEGVVKKMRTFRDE